MTHEQFVAKWKGSQLGERQASQEQFIDLCRLLDEKTPAEADATGESYCFERGAATFMNPPDPAQWLPGFKRRRDS